MSNNGSMNEDAPSRPPSNPAFPGEQRPVVSNSITLSAVGAMLLVAAIGILILITSSGNRWAGLAVVAVTGIIVVIAGAVVIYTATTRKRLGWFLPFTIVGAVLAIPVSMIGAATASAWSPNYWPEASEGAIEEEWTGSWDEPDWEEEWEDSLDGTPGHDPLELRVVDPATTTIVGNQDAVVLDLTDEPNGTLANYDVQLTDSVLMVILNQSQLPMIDNWTSTGSWGGLPVEVIAPMDITDWPAYVEGEQSEMQMQLNQWRDSNFRGPYPWKLEDGATGPSGIFRFNISAEGPESMIRFVVLDIPTSSTALDSADTDAQSGQVAQSGAADDTQGGN